MRNELNYYFFSSYLTNLCFHKTIRIRDSNRLFEMAQEYEPHFIILTLKCRLYKFKYIIGDRIFVCIMQYIWLDTQ